MKWNKIETIEYFLKGVKQRNMEEKTRKRKMKKIESNWQKVVKWEQYWIKRKETEENW